MDEPVDDLIKKAKKLYDNDEDTEVDLLLNDNLLKRYNNAVLYGLKAGALNMLGEFKDALKYAEQAVSIDPLSKTGYFFGGLCSYSLENYDQAIEYYSKAIQLDAKYTAAYYNRGIVWYKQKEYDKAIEDSNRVIQLDENYEFAYHNRGNAWFEKKEYHKAIDDYTKYIELDKKHSGVYFNRGNTWKALLESNKAIEDYKKAISLKESGDYYYNRAIAYNSINKYQEAIDDFKKYLLLEGIDVQNYFTKVAQTNILELEKKIRNTWYAEIDKLIEDIKEVLLFDKDCVTHYTSLSSAKAMILDKSLFRLSEGAFLNDTSEGRELFRYLNFTTAIAIEDDTIAEYFSERPFIGSFVADTKHNDLTLWRIYGKEAQAEAKGCALTIDKNLFITNLENQLNPKDGDSTVGFKDDGKFTFYKVAYRSKDNFLIPEEEEANQTMLNNHLNALKGKITALADEEQKKEVNILLQSIAYLFKSIEYQHENEVRLVVDGVGFKKKINTASTPPKVYIKLIDIVPVLKKITLGPKVEKADEWAAAFNYHIKQKKGNAEIVISHLPFK